jgi:hypothetical protein
MLKKLTIERDTGNGKYGDVLDVCEALAIRPYGTAPNAACELIRQSAEFQEALEKVRAAGADGPESSAAGDGRPCTRSVTE